jgi:hypothetical protein
MSHPSRGSGRRPFARFTAGEIKEVGCDGDDHGCRCQGTEERLAGRKAQLGNPSWPGIVRSTPYGGGRSMTREWMRVRSG